MAARAGKKPGKGTPGKPPGKPNNMTFLKQTVDPKSKLESGSITEEKQLTEVERTFYFLITEDIKRKILRLRAHILNLDVVNETLEAQIRSMKRDKKDEAGDLTGKVDDVHTTVLKLRSENETLTEAYNEEKRRSEETIEDLEKKYKVMHDQLSAEIKRLNGKLHANDEFRLNEDNWVLKFSERADELAQKEQEAKELYRQMEAKAVLERGVLKEDLLEKLTLAGEEFTGAGSTSASDLNLRLIRENIALQKNIDMLVNSNDEMDARMQHELALYESNKAKIPELEKRNRILIEESQVKLNNIKTMTDQVQKLKQEYINGLSYREQNVTIKEFQICARFRRQKLQKHVTQLGRQLNRMESEANLYEYLAEQYRSERQRVDEHLENMRLTVERAIGVTNVPEFLLSGQTSTENSSVIVQSHSNLLTKLVWLLQSDFDSLDTGRRASLETLKPYTKLTQFDELFKKEAPSLTSLMDLCVAYIESDAAELESGRSSVLTIAMKEADQYDTREYETKLPEIRALGKNYIFDVESGTSLYYSSEPDDPELMEKKDENALEDEEEGSDSSSEAPQAGDESPSSPPDAKKKHETHHSVAPSKVRDVSQLPPGTIVDVEEEEGEVGEAQKEDEKKDDKDFYDFGEEEAYEEDEEYDINLFY